FTGEAHNGATSIYQTLSGALEFAVENFYDQYSRDRWPQRTQVTVVGEGVPGTGVAVLLANHLAIAVRAYLGHSKVIVNSITFGNPYAVNNDFAKSLRQTVENRHIMFVEDSHDLFPCPITFSCQEKDLLP